MAYRFEWLLGLGVFIVLTVLVNMGWAWILPARGLRGRFWDLAATWPPFVSVHPRPGLFTGVRPRSEKA